MTIIIISIIIIIINCYVHVPGPSVRPSAARAAAARIATSGAPDQQHFGGGDDTVGNPRRAQIYRFELFELVLLLELDKQLPVEQFEATVSQSAVPSLPS